MAEKYDVAVVGGRCAGAALATYMSRAGAKVALIDALPRHSDAVVSTHTLHPAGVDVLEELGLRAELEAGATAWKTFRFDMEGSVIDIPMPSGREEYCPRRYFLDGLLQDAAESAGADFYGRTRVDDLVIRDRRVSGVRCSRQGSTFEMSAELVVGADGRTSLTARLVGADEYLAYDAPRGCYWAYWDPPPGWRTAAYPFQGYFSRRKTLRSSLKPTTVKW
jgi:2-polyprenyl-6-methoxyphenol hydroxylase-like FAD-dependent oxidoreductase